MDPLSLKCAQLTAEGTNVRINLTDEVNVCSLVVTPDQAASFTFGQIYTVTIAPTQ
ncbi:MAG TPA: hypothetical protein VHA06_06335 [Candidatus Angelobacter sp.]|jgi:hypothetical protein|nr:hypothetical protein [Candidatus Angelobacter sp.]